MLHGGRRSAAGAASASSGNDANTLLLLHMDGTDASTTFTDSSASARTVTPFGNAQIDTADQKFGTASGLFDGTGDYLTVPDSDDWAFGTGNFTIDFWVKLVSGAAGGLFCGQWTDGTHGWRMGAFTSDGNLYFQLWDGVAVVSINAGIGLSDATWTHLAMVRNGSRFTLYKDGISIGTATSGASIANYTGVLQIASGNNSTPGSAVLSAGWLDEFRISNKARWTSNFTPPTVAYS